MKVPIKKVEEKLKEILMELPDSEEFPDNNYRDVYLEGLYHYLTYKRFNRVFNKLDDMDSLITEKNEPKKRGRPKKNPLILWKEMREIINSYEKEKGEPVTKRLIQRKFHLNEKEFDDHITFLKHGTNLKMKSGKQKNQMVYFY